MTFINDQEKSLHRGRSLKVDFCHFLLKNSIGKTRKRFYFEKKRKSIGRVRRNIITGI